MDNILSYCGLVVARISASEKDSPVPKETLHRDYFFVNIFSLFGCLNRINANLFGETIVRPFHVFN